MAGKYRTIYLTGNGPEGREYPQDTCDTRDIQFSLDEYLKTWPDCTSVTLIVVITPSD